MNHYINRYIAILMLTLMSALGGMAAITVTGTVTDKPESPIGLR